MKNSNCLFKIIVMFLALIMYSVIVFQCDFKQEQPQPAIIDQRNINKSKEDSLNTVRANILLNQKDSTIKLLNSKLAKEKANTATQKAEANKQHTINDSLQTNYQKEKDLSTCEDLVRGLKLETVEKDSVIESLDSEIENYSCEVAELNGKVEIQKGVIESKQELIACKDSTITYYKTQKQKTDFWNNVKIKVAGVIIFIETIGLILK
jgi:hypothetical protein